MTQPAAVGGVFDLITVQPSGDKRDTSMLTEREMDVVIFLSGGEASVLVNLRHVDRIFWKIEVPWKLTRDEVGLGIAVSVS